jgi:hypothetical protein
MILGLSTAAFTALHVAVSLFAIVAGAIVVGRMLGGRADSRWTAVYLGATLFTSVSGFFFPASAILPSHIFGALSLVVLVLAAAALYLFHLTGRWRAVYIVGALIAFYLNVFVAVVQAFQKLPALQPLAPTQSEPAFLLAQIVVLVLFVGLGVLTFRRFHPMRHLPT